MRRHLLYWFLATLLGFTASASAQEQRTYVRTYDLDATAYTYCVTAEPFRIPGATATTSGSSTTVSAVSPADAFDRVAVGDDILFVVAGTQYLRRVATKTSAASITVDSAVTLTATTGSPFSFMTRSCGTAATDGWVNTSAWSDKMVKVETATLTGTGGVDVSVECRLAGTATAPSQLVTGNITSTTAPLAGDTFVIPEPCASIRVGLKWGTANGAGPDSVSAYIVGRRDQ
jgi:hypothetical protein